MNNKELPTMQTITVLSKILVDAWHMSIYSDNEAPDSCAVCKYNDLCTKIEELEKVMNK